MFLRQESLCCKTRLDDPWNPGPPAECSAVNGAQDKGRMTPGERFTSKEGKSAGSYRLQRKIARKAAIFEPIKARTNKPCLFNELDTKKCPDFQLSLFLRRNAIWAPGGGDSKAPNCRSLNIAMRVPR
jgi:hypothetical protein